VGQEYQIPCRLKCCGFLERTAPRLEKAAGIYIYPDAVGVLSRLWGWRIRREENEGGDDGEDKRQKRRGDEDEEGEGETKMGMEIEKRREEKMK
jgi:hypothetical protein